MDEDPLFGHEEYAPPHVDASQCRRALRDILTVIQNPGAASTEDVLRKVQGLAEKGLMRETVGEPLTSPDEPDPD
ncbi:MAG: hypothetical protein M3124_07430 [Actinomycetota bacterium]|nr:hypothetical protein [Actinomycetota bacterium]